MEKKRALIGMSGGVDSSVAAWMVLESGYICAGATMRLHDFGCGGNRDALDAKAVADKLAIPHHLFDFQPEFEEKVIRQFVTAYEAGYFSGAATNINTYDGFHINPPRFYLQ